MKNLLKIEGCGTKNSNKKIVLIFQNMPAGV